MATSGDTSWELASTALVTAAYRKLGYLSQGQTLDAEPLAIGVEALNSVIALMVTKGMPLWKRTTLAVTLVLSQTDYALSDLVKVAQVNLVGTSIKYPLIEKSLYDFNMLPPGSTGIPVHYTYAPSIADGTLTIWPTPDAGAVSNYSLSVVYQKKFDGMVAAGDTLDFPSYWTQGIIFYLASVLAPETGVPLQDRQVLKAFADEAIKMASDYGDEDGSLYIQPTKFGRW